MDCHNLGHPTAGANSTKSLRICGCKRWCPKDLRVCAPAAHVLTHSLFLNITLCLATLCAALSSLFHVIMIFCVRRSIWGVIELTKLAHHQINFTTQITSLLLALSSQSVDQLPFVSIEVFRRLVMFRKFRSQYLENNDKSRINNFLTYWCLKLGS